MLVPGRFHSGSKQATPTSPSKGGSRTKNAQNTPWHLTHFYVKVRLVDYSSMMLKSERLSRRLRSRESWFSLLYGTQFFFKWDRANPFTLFCFLGQRVSYNARSDDFYVSRQGLHRFQQLLLGHQNQKCSSVVLLAAGRVPVGSARSPWVSMFLRALPCPSGLLPSAAWLRIKASS